MLSVKEIHRLAQGDHGGIMKKLGIYIHIPFCKQKCGYCDFYSLKWDCETEKNYMDALLQEIKNYKSIMSNEYTADTIFFGGGTPSIMRTENLKKIIEQLHSVVFIEQGSEITTEANPNTLTDDNLKAYMNMGINRLSIGVQSLNDNILRKIGRIHSSNEALNSIDMAINNGFKNINADIMFNIPGQSIKDIEDTVYKISEKQVKHISFYSLKLEKGTPMYIMEKNKSIIMPEEEEEREMYYAGRAIMKQHGLMQYEISNFAHKGYECRHNLKYWNQEEYIGIGPSAHSFLNSTRYNNPGNLAEYIQNSQKNIFEKTVLETLGSHDLMIEYIMLKLRLTEGINIMEFNKKFSADFEILYKKQIDFLIKNNLLEYFGHCIRLTEKGMDISNYVIEEFM